VELPEVEAMFLQPPSPLDAALARLPEFDGIVFGCASGVRAVLSRVEEPAVPVIAVGTAAARVLSGYGIAPTVTLRGACRDAVGEQAALFQNKKLLLITAEGGRPHLHAELERRGAQVEMVTAYRLAYRIPSLPLPPMDLVVLPSSSAAHAVLSGDLGQALLEVPMAAIGPQTETAARQCGARSVRVAKEDTVASLVSLTVSMVGMP
jgi:uroporphyrinogen III methyltransferase/synthase